jgi:hypothetical protein
MLAAVHVCMLCAVSNGEVLRQVTETAAGQLRQPAAASGQLA